MNDITDILDLAHETVRVRGGDYCHHLNDLSILSKYYTTKELTQYLRKYNTENK